MADHDSSNTHDPATKTCTKCGGVFARTDFYRDSAAKDGLRPDCKECNKRRALEWRYANHEKFLAYMKERSIKPHVRASAITRVRNSIARHPERQAAREIVKNAIKRGEMVRQPCKDCGKPNADAHHHDYTRPLEVEWLCRRCHGIEHRTSPQGRKAAGR